MPDPYITLDEAKHLVGIEDTVDDVRLSGALDAACEAIDVWCGRTLGLDVTATARLFRPDGNVVWLDGNEIGSLDDLVVKTDDNDDGTFETTWAGSDFLLEPLNARRGATVWGYDRLVAVGTRSFPCLPVRAGVQVEARWGWPAVPEPVKQAARLLTVSYWKRKDAPFGVAGFEGFAMRLRQDPDVAALLGPYKRPGIG